MAYMTPEERISGLLGRGYEGLRNRFSTLRGEAPPPAAAVVPAAAPSQLAKVPADISKIMPRQSLAPSHQGGTAARVTSGVSSGGSYDTGKTFATDGSTVALAGPNGMRQSMSVADFRTQMNPDTAPSQSNNLSVEFDPSVSQGARNAFMTDPYAPDTSRYDAYMASPRGRFFGATPLPDSSPAREGSIGEMVVDGIRQRRSQFQTGTDLTLRGQDIQAEEGGMRNRLLAERNASQIPLERAQGEAAQMEVNSALRAQRLFDAINNEPDEAKKALLTQQYKLLTGVKDDPGKTYSGTEEAMTKDGIRQTAYVLEKGPDGQWVKRVPQVGEQGSVLPPVESREIGKVYPLPQGDFKWTKEGWEKA